MSNVRVVFAEVDGSDEMVRSVISQFAERVTGRPAIAAPVVPVPETSARGLLGGGRTR